MLAELETETTVFVKCPHCGERAGQVDHLLRGPFPREWGPWSCDHCGLSYAGCALSPTEIEIEKRDEPRQIQTLDLLEIPASDKPIYIVVKGRWQEGADHMTYFYDEHTCPINWTPQIEEFIQDGNVDPHGVARFVRSVPAPVQPEGHHDYDLMSLFPEAFETGVTIDGSAAAPVRRLSNKEDPT